MIHGKGFQIGEATNRNSARTVSGLSRDRPWHLSENNDEYWCKSELGIEGRINKKSPEGERITKLIIDATEEEITPQETEEVIEAIATFLLELTITHAPPEALVRAIREARKDAFGDGMLRKTAEIKAVLGIHDRVVYRDYDGPGE